jgi:hypothetical protein
MRVQTDSGVGGDAHPWGINVNSKTLTLQFIAGGGGGGGKVAAKEMDAYWVRSIRHFETWDISWYFVAHALQRRFKYVYSQKSNCAALFPISIFIHLWAIYIFPGSVHLFCCNQVGRPIVEMYKSVTDIWKRRNWDWGRTVSFLGMFSPIFGTVHLQCARGVPRDSAFPYF